jgi:hypothetical protein
VWFANGTTAATKPSCFACGTICSSRLFQMGGGGMLRLTHLTHLFNKTFRKQAESFLTPIKGWYISSWVSYYIGFNPPTFGKR